MVSVTPINQNQQVCHVCGQPAFVECLLYDVYLEVPEVFLQRDDTCPFLCVDHFQENEANAFSSVRGAGVDVTLGQIVDQYEEGVRRMDTAIEQSIEGRMDIETAADILRGSEAKIPALRDYRGSVAYPHTNKHGAQGFTIYRELK